MAGLLAHWFGELPLAADWLAERARRSVADLGERYHAEDHVPVDVERLFHVLLRTHGFRRKLHDWLHRIRAEASHLVGTGDRSADAASARRAVDAVLAIERHIGAAAWAPWAATGWSGVAKTAQGSVSVLSKNLRDDWRAREGPARRYSAALEAQQKGLTRLADYLEELDRLWLGRESQAEHQRVVLLTGRGGSGKSHLLARHAEAAAKEGRSVVMVLGQRLGFRAIWPQILEHLDVEGPYERFLQALDSAAEAANMRALFIVDALNEGAGATAWRNELASFIASIAPYPNIACVLSCRSEYLNYVVPAGPSRSIVQVEVRGFVTREEQRMAALVYMDRKGLARPGGPWLAEEFTNPLFLRSVCVALAREGGREFPRGLVGIKKILTLYIDSVARHLTATYEGTNELLRPTLSTLQTIASAMATERRDFLPRDAADSIVEQRYATFLRPVHATWLEVLHRSGLLRFDPDPRIDPDSEDPMPLSVDVVRFSFQRFQDHLMAEALLRRVDDISLAFAEAGALHFLAGQEEQAIWGAGVLAALAVQVPERFRQELVDVMPGGLEQWRDSGEVAAAFSESIRLRAPEAFSARTTELFEAWLAEGASSVSLLFEVATLETHPWNSEAMHGRLVSLSMPERDTRWTIALSGMGRRSASHRFFSLCDWCASPEARTAPDRTRELAALALAWCLTSSNRRVRDESTKALTHLMLAQAGVMTRLTDRLMDVNDNYVSERLWAAAFGACTHDPNPLRLGSYAKLAWRTVFSKASVPRNFLLRDYARAIVELAVHSGADLEGVDPPRGGPPYADAELALEEVPDLDKAFLEGLGDGADRIVSSCHEMGDFGSYCIEPAVDDVTTIPLNALPVVSKESAFRNFWAVALAGRQDRITAYRALEDHLRLIRMHQRDNGADGFLLRRRTPTETEIECARQLKRRLLSLLTTEEAGVFRRDGEPWLEDSYSPPHERVDSQKCRAWVARRAIELGGTAVDVGSTYNAKSERPIVERLGKKYQWLALSELLCHLTSNLGIEMGYHEDRTVRCYDLPPDVGLVRDIDPTVLAYRPPSELPPADAWMFAPRIFLEEVSEKELGTWPARADPSLALDKKVVRTEPGGRRWITLYDHVHVTDKYAGSTAEHGMRQQEFRRIFTVFVENADLAEFVTAIERKADLNVSDWEVPQLTDGPFLGEAIWRATWPQAQWRDERISAPRAPLAFPIYDYRWESHLDVALPEGARAYVPAAWLTRMLRLRLSPNGEAFVRDATDQVAFIQRSSPDDSVVLLREDALTHLSADFGLNCVWLLVAERNAWPGGVSAMATWRRAEGVAWVDGDNVVCRRWFRDHTAAEVAARRGTASRRRQGK